ncbi:3-oxoacyl-[acyl-carrier protein] reductase [Epibacterium ulvae]|uniref:3-oxoacyl-[acyl-carrier protein] reductase n=1 Tax=Epibacterium ulvae TaxID=1156985 RepID=A0A1G5QG14_9RHOB|nr:SDR family NAD(P)-dependent oxidoreductase [Epibacterium ulvae]SCZ60803.1 3-oxoacyl-[acyl-carrier protein] reductase [Epibacterium ulvae]
MNFEEAFKGKCVVVTGAAGIMGRALADQFEARGAMLCRTDVDAAGLSGFSVSADLTQDKGLDHLLSEVAREWGAPDVVINNAALYPSAFMLDMEVSDWDRIMSVNLRAPFVLTRGFALQMIQNEVRGNVINISSGAARKMRRTMVTYCMSKTALDRLTKGFALELAEFGIRVNALEPGFAAGSAVSELPQEHVDRVMAAIPLGAETTAEDVGNAALYLASDAARNVTGATLSVDGGNSAGSLDVYQDKKSPL